MTSPASTQQAPRPVTPKLIAVVLGFELFVVLFISLAILGAKILPLGWSIALFVGLLGLTLASLSQVRKPLGLWLGSVLQVCVLAISIIAPMTLIVAVVFICLWIFALVRGRRMDVAAGTP